MFIYIYIYNLYITLLNKVYEVAYLDGNRHRHFLYYKSLRYQHLRENYQTSLLKRLISLVLQIKRAQL